MSRMQRPTVRKSVTLIPSTTDSTTRHARGSSLLGTWKLQSFTSEFPDTGQTVQPFGAHPSGYLSYGADCRMYAILVGDGRRPPARADPTDAEKIELFEGMGAYAGTYTIEGDKVVHHVDISWNEAWTGTAQVRQFKVEGNLLRIRAQDSVDGRPAITTLLWRKIQP